MRTTAMTIFGASTSIGGLLGNIVGGVLLEHISVFSLYKILAAISLICIFFAAAIKKVNNVQSQVLVEEIKISLD
jgi:MFS family permease